MSAVVSVSIHPFCEFRHGPIVEDAGSAVIATESFRADGRFADFLSGVKQYGAAREAEENCGYRTADVHSGARPEPWGGEADFIVILCVAQRTVKNVIGSDAFVAETQCVIEVVGPPGTIVDIL